MQLVEAGHVDLDSPVRHYIPWFRVADARASQRITVRHLLTMTSGLPQAYDTQLWTDDDDGALERAVRRLKSADLSRPVGAFGYANANSETLGLLVQIVSGLSYEEYVTRRIFTPLAMRDSFTSPEKARHHGMATGYRWWFGLPVPITLPDNRAELPAGHLVSSAEDMSHFLVAQMNGGRFRGVSLLSPGGIARMQTGASEGTYAMGWESARVDGRRLVGHDGGTANFQTSIFFDPDARVGVFVAANAMNALDALASPHGLSRLDGPTVRAMAQSVLSLALHRPLPDQGPGHERLTLTFDLAILTLTGALALALIRLRDRRRVARGVHTWRQAARRGGLAAISNVSLLVLLLYLRSDVPAWNVVVRFQPDLEYWLYAVAVALAVRGVVQVALVWNGFRDASP